jgi:hypothetical protein
MNRKYTSIIANNEQPPHNDDSGQRKRPCITPPSPEPQQQEAGISSITYWLHNHREGYTESIEGSPEILYNQLDPDASSMASEAASARSRSSSPSKTRQAQYRALNLRSANIHIDVEVPRSVIEQIRPHSTAPLPEDTIQSVAKQLYTGARDLVNRGTANEDEWQGLFSEVIVGLLGDSPAMLNCLPKRGLRKTGVVDVQG